MQSIYWVLSWACHRRCRHCYDDRFRPYRSEALPHIVGEGQAVYRAIIANLPDAMHWQDPGQSSADGTPSVKRTTLVMAGGELLLDGVREQLFYPALDAIAERWGRYSPRIAVQTTGDIMTPRHIEAMLARGVGSIAIASIDDFHVGLQGDRGQALMDRIRAMMAPLGAREVGLGGTDAPTPGTPTFLFFGARDDHWIGELWPRGRAWQNGLSSATYATNFCARWSGGKGFLAYGQAGSEIAIEPDGSVYPCCLKTKAPLGSLAEERLTDILDSLRGHPALEAINAGDPEAMGIAHGWSRDAFRTASHTVDPAGRAFANPCIGCDAFFAERLGAELAALRVARLARNAVTAPMAVAN